MQVFETSTLAGIRMKNRILRSATYEGMCDALGHPQPSYYELYEKLSSGGAGAIITGYVAVNRTGRMPRFMGIIDDDAYIEEFRKLSSVVQANGTPIIMQIAHCGGFSNKAVTNAEPVAPSPFVNKLSRQKARELSYTEIEDIVSDFVKAIIRVRQAGFDGVELHAAHGYLLSEFLSPHVNKRTDRWGGTTENRCRIIIEILERARKEVGDYPILIKISAYDFDKGGMRIDESIKIAPILEKAGCSAIEVSCGGINDSISSVVRSNRFPVKAALAFVPPFKNMPSPVKFLASIMMKFTMKSYTPLFNYNVDAAVQIKQNVRIPVIVVGGIHKLTDIEDIICNKGIDYISMCRPFIIEPSIVKRFQENKQSESRCINCSYCLMGVMSAPVRCYYGKIPRQQV
jgi:2,4-dienoyl-CoA reductase-like NADH-dependent reductase (Old Yellow Enzyme family)